MEGGTLTAAMPSMGWSSRATCFGQRGAEPFGAWEVPGPLKYPRSWPSDALFWDKGHYFGYFVEVQVVLARYLAAET